MMAKKANPRMMVPLMQLDKERKKIRDEAVNWAYIIMFTAMRDKHGYGIVRLNRLYNDINYIADSISKGYVKLQDLKKELEDKMGIKFVE